MKKKWVFGILLVLVMAMMVMGCGKTESTNETTSETPLETTKPVVAKNEVHIEGIRLIEGGAQALVYEKDSWKTVMAEVTLETVTLTSNLSEATFDTTPSHDVNGYFEGTLNARLLSETLATVYLIDRESQKHLDLLEIELEATDLLWDAHVDAQFSRIYYQVLSQSGLKTFEHTLADNQTKELTQEGYSYVIGADGRLGQLQSNHEEHKRAITWHNAIETTVQEDLNEYDVVISNGFLMDPESNTIKAGHSIGIMGDTIAAISSSPLKGKETIDASGLVVSPGFIDMLAFNLNDTAAKYKITDGVTTSLSMHGCTENFNSFFRGYENNPPYVNYGGAIYAIRLRFEQGLNGTDTPNAQQIERMAERVRQEILAGGLALAFSPEYYPGTTPEEIRAMMAVAAEYDIPTHFHGRYSAISGEERGIVGVHEILNYGRETGGRVHFMHLHSTGGTAMMDEALKAIDQARSEGVHVTYDIYPYDSWISRINWERYRAGWQERYGITYSDLQMAGTSERLTEETFNYYRSIGGLCIAFAMNEEEIVQALSRPDAMVGSDECVVAEVADDSHPRGAGTFSKILGRYVRDEDYFSLMEGLRKMTINSAKHLEAFSNDMALRGRLKAGTIADITVFDYRTIMDQSTVEKPATPSIGIHYVLVSGKVGLNEKGVVTSVRAGKSIRSDFE